ncbi:MAG: transporter [Aquificota bacterium]|nr:MAG: transporter [Aquificota bacterium]
MTSTLITILLILLIARINQKFLQIPVTLSLIALSYIVYHLFPELLHLEEEMFDETLLLLLPIILLPDILHLKVEDIKKYWLELTFLALIAVGISVAIGTFITPYLLPEYRFALGMLVALYSMIMATDAITVTSIFGKFNLPHRLKLFAEGESLFNDATGLIAYYFVGMPLLLGKGVTPFSISLHLVEVFVVSTIVGMVIGFIGYFILKFLEDPIDEFIIMYVVALTAFLAAEHLHMAGILSIIASVMTFSYFIDRDFEKWEKKIEEEHKEEFRETPKKLHEILLEKLDFHYATTKERYEQNKELSLIVGHFANAFLFITMAIIVKPEVLLEYWKEILIVFVIITIVRSIMSFGFVGMFRYPARWGAALTLAGTRGGLSIIMVHTLPNDFIYKEMFEAIVVGVVVLTTFLYTFILLGFLKWKKAEFENDMKEEEKLGIK